MSEGVIFLGGSGDCKLVGAGTLAANAIHAGSINYGNGIFAADSLELVFTGDLTVHGGSGKEGHGISTGSLTVSAAPSAMDIRPGAGTDGCSIQIDGSFTNHSGIPDAAFHINSAKPTVWPAYRVVYEAPDAESGTVPADAAYYAKDTVVTVLGNTGNLSRSGYNFMGWEYEGVIYTEGSTLTVPDYGITLTANFKKKPADKPSGNGGGGGGSSYTDPDLLRGTWIQTESGGWMFRQTDGTCVKNRWGKSDGLWYWFDGEGRMLTGWQNLGGRWYYLCTEETARTRAGMKEGAMITGWYFDLAYQAWFFFGMDGAMVTGWHEIDGKRYYFNPVSDGTMGAWDQTV